MIVTEYITLSVGEATRKYSDENRYIVDKDGVEYEEAVDLLIYPKEYTEGRPIEPDPEPEPEPEQ